MKYNPRVNELVARTESLAWAHPYQPESLSQGAMEIMAELERCLAEITGMDALTLQPAAGCAWRDDRHHADAVAAGETRRCAEEDSDSGFGSRHESGDRPHVRLLGANIASNARGLVDVDVLEKAMG